tara:strand:- start:111 stop:602 length:492 start_codon:yes stop_codon:yes gene_type:complete
LIKNFRNKISLILVILSLGNLLSQNTRSFNNGIHVTDEKFYTDIEGNILININVLGHVKDSGSHLVFDGIDLPTLISVIGGPLPGANMRKIKLIRSEKDSKNNLVYTINLESFYKNGDKSNFVQILPNDTIIIEETWAHTIFSSSNALTTILQILAIYLTIIS